MLADDTSSLDLQRPGPAAAISAVALDKISLLTGSTDERREAAWR